MKNALFVILFSLAVYAVTGAPQVVMQQWLHAQELAEAEPEIRRLHQAVEADTDNPNVWAALGQIYMETGQYSQSAAAFKQAVLKSDGAPELILMYNKALIFAASGEVSDAAKQGMEVVLKLRPGNPEARYFLALRKLQDGDAEHAMQDMKALYHELPENSPLKTVMDRQIGRK